MTRRENQSIDATLFDSLAETFELRPPVYEFDFCAGGRSSGDSAGTSPAANNFDDPIRTDRLDDLTSLPFADASAQTIICRGALEHVFEPRRAMAEMQRILKPGGMIFISVPGSRPRQGANSPACPQCCA